MVTDDVLFAADEISANPQTTGDANADRSRQCTNFSKKTASPLGYCPTPPAAMHV
jgi:hypothetical protein